MTLPLARGPVRRAWHGARRSLRARLVMLFLLLALAMTLTFMGGMQAVMRYGWQEVAEPLIADYVDRLTAEIGTPPDVARAEALTRRLPIRIRIEGPVVNWSSQPDERGDARRQRGPPGTARGGGWRPVRVLADGHRASGFGLAALPRDDAPEDRARMIGWGHAARDAAAGRDRLLARAQVAGATGRHPRRCHPLRRGRLLATDPAAHPGRTRRTRAAGQRHGRGAAPPARRQAPVAAGDQPRAALAVDAGAS